MLNYSDIGVDSFLALLSGLKEFGLGVLVMFLFDAARERKRDKEKEVADSKRDRANHVAQKVLSDRSTLHETFIKECERASDAAEVMYLNIGLIKESENWNSVFQARFLADIAKLKNSIYDIESQVEVIFNKKAESLPLTKETTLLRLEKDVTQRFWDEIAVIESEFSILLDAVSKPTFGKDDERRFLVAVNNGATFMLILGFGDILPTQNEPPSIVTALEDLMKLVKDIKGSVLGCELTAKMR